MDMIQVDYETLWRLLLKKGMARRKLALEIGVDEGKLAAAFRRKSKMHISELCSIAAVFNIDPVKLLAKDEDGNILNPADVDAIRADQEGFSAMLEEFSVDFISEYLLRLNEKGLEEVRHFAEMISEIPRFQKQKTNSD